MSSIVGTFLDSPYLAFTGRINPAAAAIMSSDGKMCLFALEKKHRWDPSPFPLTWRSPAGSTPGPPHHIQ
ncbi:hypothetical protein DFH07DRAFT_961032 [Mycena maculata]|uniref:Uncharacterized protein n=1 Tax=Mycena maculata TaxID=230809 RepID=A0AAD7IXA4_9AGAR|nr:hypothetical protein DFH07DRAFT_961032 [Mycena maculata]